jgi:hypothetical protein
MTVSDILDGSFRGLRATFLPVALVVVVLIGPLQLLLNLALSRIAPDAVGSGFAGMFEDIDQPVDAPFDDVGAFFGVASVGGILCFLIATIVSAAVVTLVLQVDRGEQPDAGGAIRQAARVFGTVLGASLLLLLGGGLAFLVVTVLTTLLIAAVPPLGIIVLLLVVLPGGVILGGAFFGLVNVLVPIAVIERRGVLATIGRAFWVLRTRFWRVVGVSLLVALLVGIVGFAAQLPFMILATFAGGVGWVAESVGEVLSQVIGLPITVFAIMLVYLDARVRFEGLDLELRSRSFGAP